jgi:septum site-determining protein MinC
MSWSGNRGRIPVTIAVRSPLPIRFRGRSYLALVLTPTVPLEDWFEGLDSLADKAPGFFRKRPIVVDASLSATNRAELRALMKAFADRGVRVVGLEGVQASWAAADLPPLFVGGRDAAEPEMVEPGRPAAEPPRAAEPPAAAPAAPAAPAAERRSEPPSAAALLVAEPIRSGQSIFHPDGDVTVVGSVASGAEIVAGGSIHVYGALRGRALAGCAGNAQARIFCRRMEAELLSIDGLYRTAEDLPPELEGRPVQAWLDKDIMRLAALG